MPSYGDLFMRDYGIVQEVNFGKGLKEILSDDGKNANNYLKAANKSYAKKHYIDAIKEYKESRKYFTKVRQNASKIGEDELWEHIVRIILTPTVLYLMQWVISDFNPKTFTKTSTINIIDKIIKQIDDRINGCNSLNKSQKR